MEPQSMVYTLVGLVGLVGNDKAAVRHGTPGPALTI